VFVHEKAPLPSIFSFLWGKFSFEKQKMKKGCREAVDRKESNRFTALTYPVQKSTYQL